ncbi:MAG: hypothetical protein ACYS47_09675 [Planctomycetota bacterium]|jgi:hypothetical protein
MRPTAVITGVLLPILFGLPAVLAQDPEGEGGAWEAEREILAARKASFEFTDAPLDVVASFVGGAAGIDFRVDPDLSASLEEEGFLVTVRLREASLWNVLQLLLELSASRLAREGDAVVLTRRPHAFAPREEAVYDLGRIVHPARMEPGKVLDLVDGIRGQPMFETGWEPVDELIDPEFVVAMIQEKVAPNSWAEEGFEASLSGVRLKIVHTAWAHEAIRKLLRQLERFREPDIGFRVRVLQVLREALPAHGGESPVAPPEEERLSRAAAETAQPFGEYRLSMGNGERVHLFSGDMFSLRVERSKEDERLAKVRDGALIDLHALSPGKGKVGCVVRVSLTDRGSSSSGLPRLDFFRMESAVLLRAGETRIVSFGTSPFGSTAEGSGGLCTLVLLSGQPGPWPAGEEAAPVPDPETESLRSRLDEVKPPVDYIETPLPEVVRDLADRCGINLLIHPRVLAERDPEELLVNLKVVGLPLNPLLSLICRFRDLRFHVGWGVVLIDTEEGDRAPRPAKREFPVLDILGGPPVPRIDDLARGLHHPGEFEAFDFNEEENRVYPETLLHLVRELVSPESWDVPPNALEYRLGRLIASNAPGVLDRTESLLDELRRRIWEPVAVEGMFLSVSPAVLDGEGLEGPVLLPEKCRVLERIAARGPDAPMARFRVEGTTGSVFRASGGRQVAYVRSGDPGGEHAVDAFVEGWRIFGRAAAGAGAALLMNVNAYVSVRSSSGAKAGLPDPLETLRFETDLPLERGAGTLIGGGPDPARPGARVYLYLRLR